MLPNPTSDPGTLANNYMFVRGLQSALSTTDTNLKAALGSLSTVIQEECWRQWRTMEGKSFGYGPAEFRRFIEAPRPAGCQTKIEFVLRLLRGTDLYEPFRKIVGEESTATEDPSMLPSWYITLVCVQCGDTYDIGRVDGQDLARVRTIARAVGWFRNDQGEDVCHRHAPAPAARPA